MKTTLKSMMIKPANVLFTITFDEAEPGGWNYAFEIDDVVCSRHGTRAAADAQWTAEYVAMRDDGAAF